MEKKPCGSGYNEGDRIRNDVAYRNEFVCALIDLFFSMVIYQHYIRQSIYKQNYYLNKYAN